MSVKLFIFIFTIWLIGIFLSATFEYQNTVEAAGVSYSTGTATFTNGSTAVVGSGTSWDNSTMENGLIQLDADEVWCKICTVTDATHLLLCDNYTGLGGSGAYTMASSPAWIGETEASEISPLVQYRSATEQLPVLGPVPLPSPTSYFFANWLHIILWDFSFLHAPGYEIVRWFLFGFAIAGALSFVLLFVGIIRGNVTWG